MGMILGGGGLGVAVERTTSGNRVRDRWGRWSERRRWRRSSSCAQARGGAAEKEPTMWGDGMARGAWWYMVGGVDTWRVGWEKVNVTQPAKILLVWIYPRLFS